MKFINAIRTLLTKILVVILMFYVVIFAVPVLLVFLLALVIAPQTEEGLSKEEMTKRLKELTAKLKSELPNVNTVKVTRN